MGLCPKRPRGIACEEDEAVQRYIQTQIEMVERLEREKEQKAPLNRRSSLYDYSIDLDRLTIDADDSKEGSDYDSCKVTAVTSALRTHQLLA